MRKSRAVVSFNMRRHRGQEMKRFGIVVAVLVALVALGYFALIPRNAYSWMAAELSDGGMLPVDPRQRMKEVISVGLLVLSLGTCGVVAVMHRSRVAVVGSVVLATALLGAWYGMFWQI